MAYNASQHLMTTSRILPFAEWTRLQNTELAHLATLTEPNPSITVIVVEQDEQIVGCWSALVAVHVEGLWLREHSPTAARMLLNAMSAHLQEQGCGEVLTASNSPTVDALLEKVAAQRFPWPMWVIPVDALGRLKGR